MFWRPGSIRQLVLLGLLAVLAPLCIAIFYTVQAIDELSSRNDQVTRGVVSVTRITQLFQFDVLELERRARQYLTVGDESLLELFVRERERLGPQLAEIGKTLQAAQTPDTQLILAQKRLSGLLASLPEDREGLQKNLALFAVLAEMNQEFQQLSQAYVDTQVELNRKHATEIRDSLYLMVGLLAIFTVIISFLYVYWVNSPIKQLESQIANLGSGDMDSPIAISGPREMQALGRQLDWLRRQLNELEEQKKQFLMHMSHELKTPLASLKEGVDLIADGVVGEVDSRLLEIVDIIQQNSRDLQHLIENLLDYNQVLHGRNLSIELVDLKQLWRDLVYVNHMTIRKKGLKLYEGEFPNSWPTDTAKMRTVLDNLLSNAVNYTPQGGEISVRCEIGADMMTIDVANSGTSIPEAEHRRIFQPFFQGSVGRSGPIKGSGIGLSVARECALALGGTLELVEHEDLPVCFRFLCPRGEAEQ